LVLTGAYLLVSAGAWAQQVPSAQKQSPASVDLAATFSAEGAKLATASGGTFWLKGGGVDAAVTLWKGFGVAAGLNGEHAANAGTGVDVNEVEVAAGPRYTYSAWSARSGASDSRRLQLFGQGLVGMVHGFNGIYPNAFGAASSANSLALDAGGGVNILFSERFGVRLLEADYVRTALPNNGSNVQNDLRVSFGVTYRLGRR
jgi:hypothetical protein